MSFSVYRIENPVTNNGLWYNANRELTAFITTLTNAKCKDLPMPFDPELYSQSGLAWLSATDRLDDILDWCSLQDLEELTEAGYGLYKFTVSHYRQVPGHAVFAREHVIACEKLDVSILQKRTNCSLGVGCDEVGACYADAYQRPEECGRRL